MNPATETLQSEIAKHFESAHCIRKVGFRLHLYRNDFWETFREENSDLLPPRRHEMRAYPAGFDTRRLTPADIRKLKTLAAANGFHYAGVGHARNNQIFFIERQSPVESLGQELAATWAMEAPFRSLPKIEPSITDGDRIEASRIFLRFVKSHGDMLELEEIRKAVRINNRFLRACDAALIKDDRDWQGLVAHLLVLEAVQVV